MNDPNRIESIFARHRETRTKALMPFVCAGYPAGVSLKDVLPGLEQAGAGIVEVGFPFSDPIADGPVIASAMNDAMLAGMTPARVMEEARAARPETNLGMVAMVSISIVHRMGGAEGFCERARAAGFDGLIVPDAPVEHAGALQQATARHGLTLSLLVAPTTPIERAEMIAKACTGFVYVLARTGITGEQSQQTDSGLQGRISALRKATSLPLACGFGISTRADVSNVVKFADAAIVGSALVRRMGDGAGQGGVAGAIAAASAFTLDLSHGLAGDLT